MLYEVITPVRGAAVAARFRDARAAAHPVAHPPVHPAGPRAGGCGRRVV